MAKAMKAVFHPIGNLFTRPRSVFGKSKNWISDWAVPMGMGMLGPVGLAGATAYGGWRGYSQKQQQIDAMNRDRAGVGLPPLEGAGWGDVGWGMLGGASKGMMGAGLAGGVSALGSGGAAQSAGYAGAVGGMKGAGSMATGYAAGTGGTALGSATAAGGAGIGAGGTFMQGASLGMLNASLPVTKALGLGVSSGGGGGGGMSSMLGAGGAATGGAGVGGATGAINLNVPLTAMGIGSLALGSMRTTPNPPQIGDIAAKWLTSEGITKAGKLARSTADIEWTGDWSPDKETTAFIDVSGKEIAKAYSQRRTSLDEMGQATNSQWRTSGERLEMHRRLNEEEQRETDTMRSQWLLAAKQNYNRQKYDYIMKTIAADEDTKRDLLYADIADVMWKYQVERDDVLNFRKVAQDAGMYMLGQGVGQVFA